MLVNTKTLKKLIMGSSFEYSIYYSFLNNQAISTCVDTTLWSLIAVLKSDQSQYYCEPLQAYMHVGISQGTQILHTTGRLKDHS